MSLRQLYRFVNSLGQVDQLRIAASGLKPGQEYQLYIANNCNPPYGTQQKRPFTISGDELKWRTPASSGGGLAEVVLKHYG